MKMKTSSKKSYNLGGIAKRKAKAQEKAKEATIAGNTQKASRLKEKVAKLEGKELSKSYKAAQPSRGQVRAAKTQAKLYKANPNFKKEDEATKVTMKRGGATKKMKSGRTARKKK